MATRGTTTMEMNESEVLIVKGSKLKSLVILLLSIAFVIAGVFKIMAGVWFGWVVACFFGLGIPVSIMQFIIDTYLKLDKNGFEVKNSWKAWRLSWQDVESFHVTKTYRNKMVAVNFSSSYNKIVTGRRIASALTGVEGAINNQYKLTPDQLCELLNEWKTRYTPSAYDQNCILNIGTR